MTFRKEHENIHIWVSVSVVSSSGVLIWRKKCSIKRHIFFIRNAVQSPIYEKSGWPTTTYDNEKLENRNSKGNSGSECNGKCAKRHQWKDEQKIGYVFFANRKAVSSLALLFGYPFCVVGCSTNAYKLKAFRVFVSSSSISWIFSWVLPFKMMRAVNVTAFELRSPSPQTYSTRYLPFVCLFSLHEVVFSL